MIRKTVFTSVIFFVFLFMIIFPDRILKLSDVRPPFFVLKIPTAETKVEDNRVIYSQNGIEVAEYNLLGITGAEVLCKCKKISVEIDDNCYVKLKIPLLKKKEKSKSVFVAEVIKVRGIRFDKSENGGFVTGNPVPLSIIPELSFKGIENFIKKIGKEYKKKCRVGLLSPNEIRKNIVAGGEKTLIAERDGLPVLIFYSVSGLRENPVSEKILKRLKYEVFIPLKLKIL